jgi:hypothetical protein
MRIPRGNGPANNRVTSTGNISSGATHIAQSAFSGAMQLVQQYQDQKDHSDTQEAMNKAIQKRNEWKVSNFSRTGKAAEGMTEEYLKTSKEIDSELTGNLSGRASRMFREWHTRETESDKLSVMLHQKKQDEFVKVANFNDGIKLAQETVRTDAKNWKQAFSHLETTLELGKNSGVIKEEEFDKKRADITNKLRSEMGKSYYTQDKHDFMKHINEFGFGKPEIAAYQDRYKKDLAAEERERKALFAEEARLLYGQKDDMKAQAVANENTEHFFHGAEKLRAMGYKDWAKNLEDEGKLYDKVISFNQEHKNRPLSEEIAAARALEVSPELDGSGLEHKSKEAITREVHKKAKLFDQDPAGYVSAWAQGRDHEEIASSRMELQRKQGLMPSKGHRILSNQEKDYYKNAWESTENAAERTSLVMDIAKYGKFAPQVISEMGIERSLALAPLLENPRDVELMVAAASTKNLITDDKYKAQDYSYQSRQSKLYKTLAEAQKEFPADLGIQENLKSMEKVMNGIGMRKQDTGAGAKFFDGNFSVERDGDKLIYFPKSVDADTVIKHLDEKKEEITRALAIGDEKTAQVAKWAVRDYTWINSATGFVLADKKTGRAVPGSQVGFEEVSELYKTELAKRKGSEAQKVTSSQAEKHYYAMRR